VASTWIGVAAGSVVLAVVVAVRAWRSVLSDRPIADWWSAPLLLTFGLQWFRKGVMRVAARGFAGIAASVHEDEA